MNKQLSQVPSREITELINRAEKYAEKAFTHNTKRAFRSDWQKFQAWCSGHGLESMPAAAGTVALYITDLTDLGHPVATIQRYLSTIQLAHESQKHDSPVRTLEVQTVLKGIKRDKGTKQIRKKPLTTTLIKEWIAKLDDSLVSKRDKALVLVGYAASLRRSEIVALDFEDVALVPEGVVLWIASSKTDQEGDGVPVGLDYGKNGACPVRALKDWIDSAGIESGPLFRAFWKGGNKIRSTRMTARSVSIIVKKLCKAIGINPEECGGHSLRAGFATEAMRNNTPERVAMEHGRWSSRSNFRRYVRDGRLFHNSTSKMLDL
jgi:site-specific recombinase XerD